MPQGRPREGVVFQVAASATRLDIQSPDGGIDVNWLGRQRQELGDADFRAALEEVLDPDRVANLLALLDQAATPDVAPIDETDA